MAPSRGKGKNRAYPLRRSSPTQGTRRTARTTVQRNRDAVHEVFKDLLAEASADNADDTTSDRPLKKRKVGGPTLANNGAKQNLQTVEDSSASSDNSSESEFDFEDVDLEQPTMSSPAGSRSADDVIADVSVAVDSKVSKRTPVAKRKAATPAEKAHRLLVHKLHILCLLGHVMYINTWCNDSTVHEHLLELLPKKTASYLTYSPEHSQFQQKRSFMDGLQQACEVWRGAFKITASGIRRARWSEPGGEPQEGELDPLDRQEFRRAAKELEGSQDVGNQLFCALLRAAGVEARIVFSLQVLPFGLGLKDKAPIPEAAAKKTVYATNSGRYSPATDSNTEDVTMQNSATVGKVPSARRRLGQPSFPNTPPPNTVKPRKKRPIRKLSHPVFWVEAFNRAHQTWVPVDPLVTQTVGKVSKLEPPASYEWNQMSYVIAFESDGVARDITKRYAKAYNAKTRRLRVESAEQNGTAWLRKALRLFRRPRSDDAGRDRDQIEDSQLAQREAQEGLPNNVQDFKHHPYYALERHLRRHEVIHPRREVGKVNAGTAARPRMEVVFRGSDVQACKSAEKWFRVGREIKEGEQPLKRVPARRSRNPRAASDDDQGEVEISALYAPFQTTLYNPPPVVKGKVPKNAYGNLDIYVPSMVPPGGAHIRHPLAKEAARKLRIDAVDAVTGFKFQGRQGTAVIEGVIVAEENKDAVEATIDGLQDDQTEKEGMARSALALKMWRRFLTGLRIKERVSAYGDGTIDGDDDVDVVEDDNDVNEAAGGFIVDVRDQREEGGNLSTAGKYSLAEILKATPSKRARVARRTEEETDEEGEAESSGAQSVDEVEGGLEPDASAMRTRRSRRLVVKEDSEDGDQPFNNQLDGMLDDEGGGFVPKEGIEGGFIIEDERHTNDTLMQGYENGGGSVVDEQELAYPHAATDHKAEQLSGNILDESIPTDDHEDTHMPDKSATPTPRIQTPTCDVGKESGVNNAPIPGNVTPDTLGEGERTASNGEDVAPAESAQTEWQVHGLVEAQQHVWPDEADHESDRGSMLSHDPEDEDAEPDWLESD